MPEAVAVTRSGGVGTTGEVRYPALKPFFIAMLALGTLLTAVAFFTPGWRIYRNNAGNWNPTGSPIYTSTTILDGLVTNNCGEGIPGECGEQPGWELSTAILVGIAFGIEILALVWAMGSYSTFCLLRPGFFYPLPVLTLVATILLIVGVSVFGANYNYIQGGYPAYSFNYPLNPQQYYNPAAANMGVLGTFPQVNLGYSYWLAVAAAAVMAVTTLAGCATSATSARSTR